MTRRSSTPKYDNLLAAYYPECDNELRKIVAVNRASNAGLTAIAPMLNIATALVVLMATVSTEASVVSMVSIYLVALVCASAAMAYVISNQARRVAVATQVLEMRKEHILDKQDQPHQKTRRRFFRN